MRLNRLTGWGLALIPAGWGLLGCAEVAEIRDLLVLGVGALWARSLGCLYNDWVDRDVDARICRTRGRPFARGQRPSTWGWIWLACFVGLSCLIWLWILPWRALIVGIIAVCGTVAYPWAKRCLAVPQVVLALVFPLGALMAPALHPNGGGEIWGRCLIFWGAAGLWVLVYDTVYAFQDYRGDRQAGVGSLALWLGPLRAGGALKGLVWARYGLLAGGMGVAKVGGGPNWPLLAGLAVLGTTLKVELSHLGRLPFKRSVKLDCPVCHQAFARFFTQSLGYGAAMTLALTLGLALVSGAGRRPISAQGPGATQSSSALKSCESGQGGVGHKVVRDPRKARWEVLGAFVARQRIGGKL